MRWPESPKAPRVVPSASSGGEAEKRLLHGLIPLPYVADELVTCPYCGEEVEIFVEPDVHGSFVQDCEVCCNPWLVRVERGEEDERAIFVGRADGSTKPRLSANLRGPFIRLIPLTGGVSTPGTLTAVVIMSFLSKLFSKKTSQNSGFASASSAACRSPSTSSGAASCAASRRWTARRRPRRNSPESRF